LKFRGKHINFTFFAFPAQEAAYSSHHNEHTSCLVPICQEFLQLLTEFSKTRHFKWIYNRKQSYTIEILLPFWHHWPCPTEPSLNLFHLTSGKTEKERHQNFATRDRHKKLN